MARRKSFSGIITQIARDLARLQREQERLENARHREYERSAKQAIRVHALTEKEAKQNYVAARIEEVEELNKELAEKNSSLNAILEKTLEINDAISFDDLRIRDKFREFRLPLDLSARLKEPRIEEFVDTVKAPTFLDKLIPGSEKRYQKALDDAKRQYEEFKTRYEKELDLRNKKIKQLEAAYDEEKSAFEQKMQQRNLEVDEFQKAYVDGDAQAVCSYCTMVLERSYYPEEFPQEFRVAYLNDSKELVIDYELPTIDVIPVVADYRYLKTKDTIEEKQRKPAEIKDQYQDVIAAICLRTIHEVFEADQGNNLLVVVFNGFVQSVDPSTGKDIRPYLISVRTTREKFEEINLARVDKKACLRSLGAQVSPRPAEMLPVKPVIEFDMVDARFVEQSDIMSELDSRPNLMDLNPFEFENFVSNLFEKIGFQSKLTRSSKDGGVDAVAFDPRPLLGGKVVIQAKRYKNVVGVSAVRDLYGTMINEGASKGILVATSHYGPDAYDFAKDKPIELIDGNGLLYLLDQQGIKATIIFPED